MFGSSLRHGDWCEVVPLCASAAPQECFLVKNGYSVLHHVVTCDSFTSSAISTFV